MYKNWTTLSQPNFFFGRTKMFCPKMFFRSKIFKISIFMIFPYAFTKDFFENMDFENRKFSIFLKKKSKIQKFQHFQHFITFLIFVFFSRGWKFWHRNYLQFHRKWGFSWIRQREKFQNQNLIFFFEKIENFRFSKSIFSKKSFEKWKISKISIHIFKKNLKMSIFHLIFSDFFIFFSKYAKMSKNIFFKKMM